MTNQEQSDLQAQINQLKGEFYNFHLDYLKQLKETNKAIDSLQDLILIIQDHRQYGSLGSRLLNLENAVFGDGK